MKRPLIGILLVAAVLLVFLLRPPHLVRALESEAVAGDWSAAASLADYYGTSRQFRWTGEREVPGSVRFRRTFQRNQATSDYWNSVAHNLLVRDAEENGRKAMIILGTGTNSQFERFPVPNEEMRTDYLVRALLRDSPESGWEQYAFRVLRKRKPDLAESVMREALREGILWATVASADDAIADADWNRCLDTWASALRREVPGARLLWVKDRSRLLDQVEAGNETSVALLGRIRAYDSTHPSMGLLGT